MGGGLGGLCFPEHLVALTRPFLLCVFSPRNQQKAVVQVKKDVLKAISGGKAPPLSAFDRCEPAPGPVVHEARPYNTDTLHERAHARARTELTAPASSCSLSVFPTDGKLIRDIAGAHAMVGVDRAAHEERWGAEWRRQAAKELLERLCIAAGADVLHLAFVSDDWRGHPTSDLFIATLHNLKRCGLLCVCVRALTHSKRKGT